MTMAERRDQEPSQRSAGAWPQRLNLGPEGEPYKIPHSYLEIPDYLIALQIEACDLDSHKIVEAPTPIRRVKVCADENDDWYFFVGPAATPSWPIGEADCFIEIVIDDLSKVSYRATAAAVQDEAILYVLAEAFNRDTLPRGLYSAPERVL